jgi:small subunit ribosomal protein S20
MGHSVSADKRERQNLKRAHKNRGNRNDLRRAMKKVEADVAAGTDPKATLAAGFKALDKAARKSAIPKKRADRLKSRLALALNRAKKAPAKA